MGLVISKGGKMERSEWADFHPNAADFYGYMIREAGRRRKRPNEEPSGRGWTKKKLLTGLLGRFGP
jgi:hypothetical protein